MRRRQHRRYRSETDTRRRRHIIELFVILLLLLTINAMAMVVFEGMAIKDAAWLTLTAVTTVGFGDITAQTSAGRLAIVLLIYISGIFLLAQIVGEWIDYRLDRRDRMRKGLWRWSMKNHLVILNTPDNHGSRYLRLLVEQIRATPKMEDIHIQVFSPYFPDGLPPGLENLGVVLRSGSPEGQVALEELDIEAAKFVVLLSVDVNEPRSDSINLDVLEQLHNYQLKGKVIAECVLEENRERFKRHGADAVIRPIRAYPELMVRTMAAPGTEAIIEDLFVHAGNHPRRYDVPFQRQLWGQLATRLLHEGLGTPLGYLDNNGAIVTNPAPDAEVSGQALFLMVDQSAPHRADLVASCASANNTK